VEFTQDADGTGQSFTRETPLGSYSWMDSFVYVGGAFRFFGRGMYSLWDPPRVRLADPCAPPGTQTGGRLIHRVEPVYSEEAQRKHVKGFVKVLATVAEDGSVKDVKIITGDKLLVGTAIAAVMQWRYAPFMNCGKPVEMRTMEHLTFPPNQ